MKRKRSSESVEKSSVFTTERNNLFAHKKSLPIYFVKKQLVFRIQNENRLIIIGETGCGKTTQIPQYIIENNLHFDGKIAVTQPRRVAAMSIAERVAIETNTKIGNNVGYCVRFDDHTSDNTKIIYMTDGMLLRQAITDKLLSTYSFIIIDEAHERTIHTDVLFGIIKSAQKERQLQGLSTLKIIIMSATIDVSKFSKYFHAPVLYIEGRLHPIEIYYSQEKLDDYLFSSLVTVLQIHNFAPPMADILVFLTGQEEIEHFIASLMQMEKSLNNDIKLNILPIYAALPFQLQKRVFSKTIKGTRKVVVATNIAEVSITIPGIKYVVDSGVVKAKIYKPSNGMDILSVVAISQSQAWQRCGRAGRESSGVCYRLYKKSEYENFSKTSIPEILRCNSANICLQLLALGLKSITTFDFMDKPSNESLNYAIEQLLFLGAIESLQDDELKLTTLGNKMASFPLDPKLSRCLLASVINNCTEEIITIISMLSVDSVLITSIEARDHAKGIRKKFFSVEGDHITLLNMYKGFKGSKQKKKWCKENFINYRNIKTSVKIRKQLKEICEKQNIVLKSCGEERHFIRKSLTYGYFMNVAQYDSNNIYRTICDKKLVQIHPSSVLFDAKPSYVIYTELLQTNKCYIRDLSLIDHKWLFDIAPEYMKKKLIGW